MKLILEALIKFVLGIMLVGFLIFLPAGTTKFFYGWVFMGILFIPMFIAGVIMLVKDPNLLKTRLDAKEKEKEQKKVVAFSGGMFLLGFILAGLNHRYGWTSLPEVVVIIASVIFILSYIIYAEVLRENSFLSRTIEVQDNQRVIDTGLYKLVRHPMYLATIFLFLSMPLILNSIISFVIFLVYPFIIIKRLNNEEKVLLKNLKGYKEYSKKVKYKLIPYIW